MVHSDSAEGSRRFEDERTIRELKIDTAFEVLSDAHRREILRFFVDGGPPVAYLDELAERVYQSELKADKSTDHSEVLTSLHHVHLPKLDLADYVEYDQTANAIKYNDPEGIEELLSTIDHIESGSDRAIGGFG